MKIYLTIIGLLYAALAIWCSVAPETTSQKVGFKLEGGSGQSEFLTVYGGLEFGLALILLLPWVKPDSIETCMLACLLVHAALVVFRTLGFFMFTGLESMTWKLAAGEWVILLSGLAIWFMRSKN
jgi:hypothetical protein